MHRPEPSRMARRTLGGLILIVNAFAFVLWALRSPLTRLQKLAEDVKAGSVPGAHFSTRVAGNDEVGDLARAFADASQQLRAQVERLQARDAALTEYVAQTTHDLAIPLTVLQGRLSEAQRQASAGIVDASLISGALAETHFLAQLVANMGIAARLETGSASVVREVVDLSALVERVVQRHAPIAQNKGIELDHAVPEHAVHVVGDEILIERALGNLISNAIFHPHRKVTADMPKGRVAVVLEGTQNLFELTISDDGQVDETLLESLRSGQSTHETHRSRGRGLGLRIAREVFELHEFSFGFQKNEHGGLTVVIARKKK